ncbi:MAG: 3-phosphoshikimate 1-carboxyvinyltransferase [Lachnospiraceae bacterium]|nr:3-phosphoshikimate 1-carboxyvinyltransferase [Lachnospiraceae bacterium]
MSAIFERRNALTGDINIPGDKSVSHRALILGALSDGDTVIRHCLKAQDCLDTMNCLNHLGVSFEDKEDAIIVHGQGMHGLKEPPHVLDVGNSGTTIRLLSGILAAQNFVSEISGDNSILRRPVDQVIAPLLSMGANISYKFKNNCPPLVILPSEIKGITYKGSFASSQVKSSILFCGLYADSETTIIEPYQSRDHTELLLKAFGATLLESDEKIIMKPADKLNAIDLSIPGDISSAAYFITAALITEDSKITLRGVGMNPTRNGFIDVILAMGADVEIVNAHYGLEPVADVIVSSSKLHGITLEGEIIPRALDEIPILMVLACYAEGVTVIKDAGELKIKENDRLDVTIDNLTKMGANIAKVNDSIVIEGGHPLHGAIIGTKYDHRIAMSFAIASLAASGKTEIIGSECVNTSYPGFYETLRSLFPKN